MEPVHPKKRLGQHFLKDENIARKIVNALKADNSLTTKLGGNAGNRYKCYGVIAPQKASLPYLTFGLLTDIPIPVFGALDSIEDTTFSLNIFSKTGIKNAGEILDLIKAVLDDASLTITGYGCALCMREYIGAILYNNESKVYQIPMRYRLMATKD